MMAAQTPLKEDQVEPTQPNETPRPRRRWFPTSDGPKMPTSQILRELDWPMLLLIGIVGGIAWTLLLSRSGPLTFFAGLLPVGGGLLLGRRITAHVAWHAGFLSLITAVSAITATLVLAAMGIATQVFLQQVVALGLIALLPFPAFGVWTSYQSEQRNRKVRDEQTRRGGKLERPGRVKTIEELRSLSLPQLGSFVADLFRDHEFQIKDYQFERDNYLEFDMIHDGEVWVVRVTVDDKVKQGVALQFFQKLKAAGVTQGVLITSMDFQEPTVRWAKDKPIALIDGPTLMSMHS